jgi:hypothetical protein
MVDKRVLINFSEAQYEAVAEAANKSALSFNAFVRMASYMAASKAGVEVAKPEATDAENIQVVE